MALGTIAGAMGAAVGAAGGLSGISRAVGTAGGLIQGSRNLKMQKEQQKYSRNMDQIMMDREDNAMQRRVADMKAAGLHPALAAGGQGSGAHHAAAQEAPQSKIDWYQKATLGANLRQMNANISKTEADADRTRAETENVKADHNRIKAVAQREAIYLEHMPHKLTQLLGQNKAQQIANSIAEYDFKFTREAGMRYKDSVSQWLQIADRIIHIVENPRKLQNATINNTIQEAAKELGVPSSTLGLVLRWLNTMANPGRVIRQGGSK